MLSAPAQQVDVPGIARRCSNAVQDVKNASVRAARRPPRMTRAAVEAPPPTASEVSIRRRPPSGSFEHNCGALHFQTSATDENQPRNILEEIIWFKAREIDDMRYNQPLAQLMRKAAEAGPARDFVGALRSAAGASGRPGLIAEVKKASPSRGVIQPDFDHVRIAQGYEAGGAACLSVLTDNRYFQGRFEFLTEIREAGVSCPLLCKEFIVEAYQLFKARASGADAVLLIAAVLPNKDLSYLVKSARKLGMYVLVEVHSVEELRRVLELPDKVLEPSAVLLGINNRDLQTFQVSLDNTAAVMRSDAGQEAQQRGFTVVSESAIFTPADVTFVQDCGCGAILVGESLVKQNDPEAGVKALLAA